MSAPASSSSSSSGIGFSGALFLVFLVLKLMDRISWSWWWVTAPLWAWPALFIGGGVLYVFGAWLLGVWRRWTP